MAAGTVADVDALTAAIATSSADVTFDMNADGVVNLSDLTDPTDGWLTIGGGRFGSNGVAIRSCRAMRTWMGEVDQADYDIWVQNRFSTAAAWCSGDFNADGSVGGRDLLIWNANKFTTSQAVSAVPRAGCVVTVDDDPGGNSRLAETAFGLGSVIQGVTLMTVNLERRKNRLTTRRHLVIEPLEHRRVLAVFTVTSLADSGSGSLRQATQDANDTLGADEIIFDGSLSGAIELTSGELEFTEGVEINGPGAGVITIDALGMSRAVFFNSAVPISRCEV